MLDLRLDMLNRKSRLGSLALLTSTSKTVTCAHLFFRTFSCRNRWWSMNDFGVLAYTWMTHYLLIMKAILMPIRSFGSTKLFNFTRFLSHFHASILMWIRICRIIILVIITSSAGRVVVALCFSIWPIVVSVCASCGIKLANCSKTSITCCGSRRWWIHLTCSWSRCFSWS